MTSFDKKTTLILFVLIVSNILSLTWLTVLQIQKADKQSQEMPFSEKYQIRNLEIIDQKKLNDSFKKSLNLLNQQYLNLAAQIKKFDEKNKIINQTLDQLKKQNSNSNIQYKNLTDYVVKQAKKVQKIDEINKEIDKINIEIDQNYNMTLAIAQKIPKKYYYGPIETQDWSVSMIPIVNQILAHPSSRKINIEKRSIVTFILNGLFYSNGQQIQVFLLKDNEPVVKKAINNPHGAFYYSYFSNLQYLTSLSFAQEVIIDPGNYLFQVGFVCVLDCKSLPIIANGVTYTIKVEQYEANQQ